MEGQLSKTTPVLAQRWAVWSISPLAVSSAHVRTAGGERSWHTKLIAGRRGRYGTAERTLAIAHLCVV